MALALTAGTAQADDWTGATSSDWFAGGNWADGSVPTASDDAVIDTTTPTPVIDGGTASASETVVGYTTDGSLIIQGGGALTGTSDTAIGVLAGTHGEVTVVGGGSTWTNSGYLLIAGHGAGTLTVENGGAVISSNSGIGNYDGSVGAATVTGRGSKWTTDGFLLVGNFTGSQGTLIIADQGTVVSNRQVRLANSPGSQGTALVTGAGSKWINSSQFHVGFADEGSLTIADGGEVSGASYTTIGTWDDSSGTVMVTGGGSMWNNTGELHVGGRGLGVLSIEDGGIVTNGAGFIADGPDAIGEVTVTGGGSTWTNSGELFIGDEGSGKLTVIDGGTVDSADAYVARNAGSTGEMSVTDSGSTWNAGDLYVGENGIGTLTIENGGDVNSASGDLGLYDGIGFATVTGSGSTWTNTGYMTVGEYGQGALTIEDGGKVSNSEGSIGYEPSGLGEVTVTGGGSTWDNSGDLYVGFDGKGTLAIEDGGMVDADETLIGHHIGSIGAVTVEGAGSHLTTFLMNVGSEGVGSLVIADGGLVDNLGASIGRFAGSEGHALVSGVGSLWRPAADLWIGNEGRGELTVADGAVIETDEVHVAVLAGSQGTVNIGAAAGEAPAAPGSLDTPLVQFGAGDGSLVFNHTAGNYLFVPNIAGVGQIDILAGATELNNAGGFSGTTSVNDGATLVANGTLGGALGVLSGGRLEGSGTVGTTTIAGTVTPGNSIGTLNVAGNYTQAAGSIYEVEIDAAGNSDLIDVAGTATLNGGTVEVIPFPDFALATPYTILTATGGITGAFDGAAMGFSSAFLTPNLTYGANDVTFTVAQTASFVSAALTPNQRATAFGADSLGAGNAVWNAIALLSSASALDAFDALSGEVHASAKSVLFEDSRFLREAVDARLRAAFAGVAANAMPVLAYGDEGPEAAPADTDRFVAWGHAFGSWGEWDGDGNAATLTRDTGGFVLGGDMTVAESWRLGMLAGYSHSSFTINDRASSASADSYHLGAYAGTEIGKFGLRFGGAYSWHNVDTIRTVSFPGFTDSLSAEYDAATVQFFGEAGYRIDTARASFEPFANLAYVNLHTDGFTESGGLAALTAASSSHDTTFTTLGLRAETTLPLGGMTAQLHGMLGWRHAFGGVTPITDLAFAGGGAFTIAGVPIGEDAAVIGAGLLFDLGARANLGIAYNGQIGDGVQDHGVKARFGMTF